MLKTFLRWLRGNVAYDAIKYAVESKAIMAAINAAIAGSIGIWNNYGPLVIFFAISLAAAVAANTANDIARWRNTKLNKRANQRSFGYPIVLIVLLVIGLSAFSYLGTGFKITLDQAMPNHSALFRQWNAIPLTQIDGTISRNTTVVLDGKRFTGNCVFDSVQFVFNGTAPFNIDGCQMMGNNTISTGSPPLEQFAILFLQSRFYKPSVLRKLLN